MTKELVVAAGKRLIAHLHRGCRGGESQLLQIVKINISDDVSCSQNSKTISTYIHMYV